MLLRIGSLLTSGYSEQQWIEKGFHASYLCFFNLQQIAGTHEFTDEQEQTWFYKIQQPRFVAWIEYFTLLYVTKLFIGEDEEKRLEYWVRELKKTQDFLIAHSNGFAYPNPLALTTQPGSSASYDRLAASILAREKYLEYIQANVIQSLSRPMKANVLH